MRQRTYSEVSDKRGNLQPLSLVVLGETTGLFYFLDFSLSDFIKLQFSLFNLQHVNIHSESF